MARTVEVKLWDDLADEPRTIEATHTILVGLDGLWKELDLTEANHKEVHGQLAYLMERGHDPAQVPNGNGKVHAPVASNREAVIKYRADLRQFARDNGYSVSDKGYVPKLARERFELIAGPAPYWNRTGK